MDFCSGAVRRFVQKRAKSQPKHHANFEGNGIRLVGDLPDSIAR
jgi:hypothetical protein